MGIHLKTLALFIALFTAHSSQALTFEGSFNAIGSSKEAQGDFALAAVPMYIVCDFHHGSLNCKDVVDGFFAQGNFAALVKRVDRPEDASLVLNLASEVTNAGAEIIHYEWKPSEAMPVGELKYNISLDHLLDPIAKLNKTILNISPYLVFLGDIVSANVAEGKLEIVAAVQGEVEQPKPEKPWFVSANISGSMNNQSQTSGRNGFGSLSYNYSVEKYRIQANVFSNYTKSTVADGQGGSIKAENFSRYTSLMGVWSFKKRWSAAIIVQNASDPGSNIHADNQIDAGVEWSLVPFRINENRELLFRVGLSGNKLRLDEMNVNGNTREQYLSAFANVYMYWLLMNGKANISINGRAKTNLKYKGFETYNLGTSFNYQITKAFDVNGGVTYGYTAKSITFPAIVDYTNPLQLQLLGNQPGGSLSMNLGVGFTVGNSLKKTRDRRWQ